VHVARFMILMLVVAGCGQNSVAPTPTDTNTDEGGPAVDALQDQGLAVDSPIVDSGALQPDAPPEDTATDTVDAVEEDTPSGDTEAVETIDASFVEPDSGPEDTADAVEECAPCVPSAASAQFSMEPDAFAVTPNRTRHNPLKGFMTSYIWGSPANDFPDSMEFLYLPMADVWGPDGETFSSGLEPLLEAAASRGHHVVLRVYIDYPAKAYGLPPYLTDAVSCQPYTDHGGGCSPDYDHPLLVEAMVGLLTALGAHYDGDPRLGALQIGLLGYWGEWHTHPNTDSFASNYTQTAILNAAHTAFSITQIQVRRPAANSLDLRIGFHDDSFAFSTLGDTPWFFLPSLVSAGGGERWEEVMIGGELRPELQSICFQDDYTLGTNAQDITLCIEQTHASYLLNYKAFNEAGVGYQGIERLRAEEAAIHMGYQFELNAASLKLWGLDHDDETVEAEVTLTLAQSGVAPFYYDLHAAVHAEGSGPVGTSTENLKTLLPGSTKDLTFSLGRVPLAVVNNPMEVHLTAPILQPGQRVLLATHTPGTEEDGPTHIGWELGCNTAEETLPIGAQSGAMEPGCPCICDVDGVLRTCDGSVCP